ncbi:hypothetical protein MGYG_02499 [Nannizzia gypsea CBS 118893]|uniref:Uncharacterized protein n=1 Tax=Arthroderma gypseum (strain ATCC MYA-4604 / CBS 118893) TaxID=535722 RepID=E4UMX3_ARTGP|nr:hypothetical protein MGYG_02499 [Nannizzia gypsea CBS 118893]EFQ99487.1 hypothetical protein MGYG_02499 [Nannizzia gypsea CBS 118893]
MATRLTDICPAAKKEMKPSPQTLLCQLSYAELCNASTRAIQFRSYREQHLKNGDGEASSVSTASQSQSQGKRREPMEPLELIPSRSLSLLFPPHGMLLFPTTAATARERATLLVIGVVDVCGLVWLYTLPDRSMIHEPCE